MTASRARQGFYVVAAVIGLTLTWRENLAYHGSAGYLAAWFANPASASAATDLIILSAAISLFVLAEARRLHMHAPVVYVAVGICVAMAFAIPLFLLMRERALQTASSESDHF